MLKRYQVLLNSWLADHIREVSEKYDTSFSEVIRLLLCLQLAQLFSKAHPTLKNDFTENVTSAVENMIKMRNQDRFDEEKYHKFISDTYFETRKLCEAWNVEEEKRKENSSN